MAYESLRAFLSNLQFPIMGKGKLSAVLDKHYELMLKELAKIKDEYIQDFSFGSVIDNVDKLCTLIKNAESKKTENIDFDFDFDKLFNSIKWHKFDLGYNYGDFYKIRPTKREEIISDWQGLYFKAKGLVAKAGRFNGENKIALYLSGQLALSWEECNEPADFWFSKFSFRNFKKFETIYLRAPNEYAQDIVTGDIREDASIASYMEMLPIIMACAVDNNLENDAYYVPNQLSRWVSKSDGIYGITYWAEKSKVYSISNWSGKYNIAIPVRNVDGDYTKDEVINRNMIMTKPQFVKINDFLHFNKLTLSIVEKAEKECKEYNGSQDNRTTLDFDFFKILKESIINPMNGFGEKIDSTKITILHLLNELIYVKAVCIEEIGDDCKQLTEVIKDICLQTEWFGYDGQLEEISVSKELQKINYE